jgi:hypothetical protein
LTIKKKLSPEFNRFTGFKPPKYENVVFGRPPVCMYGHALLMPEQMDRFFHIQYLQVIDHHKLVPSVYEHSSSKTGANILAQKIGAHQRNMKHFFVF